MQLIIYSILILLTIACNAFAAPSISGVSGTITNGQSITISGSGFSTKTTAAPLLSSYDNATTSNNWSGGSLGGSWTTSGTISLSQTQQRSTHTQNSYAVTYDNNSGYDSVRYQRESADDKLYVSFWMYRDNATLNMVTGSGDNAKFLRIYQDSSGTEGDTYYQLVCNSSGDAMSLRSSGDQTADCDGWTVDYTSSLYNADRYSSIKFNAAANSTLPKMQNWEHYEYYMDYPSTTGNNDATNIIWKDGATVARSIDIAVNEAGAANEWRWVMLGQVSGAYSPSYNEYIDQVYIDNTPARVFISDSSTMTMPDIASHHHSEIQVASSWSDSSITFTLNQGSFANGSTVYVYVVDSAGAVNATGEAITFGGVASDPVVTATNIADQPSGTTSVTPSCTATDDVSISGCRWATTNITYANMTNAMTNSGSLYTASSNLSVSDGNTYTIYYACVDGDTNEGTSNDSFSVSSSSSGDSPLGGNSHMLNIGSGGSTINFN